LDFDEFFGIACCNDDLLIHEITLKHFFVIERVL